MTADADQFAQALDRAHAHAVSWLGSLSSRPVRPRLGADDLVGLLGGPLPDAGAPAAEVVDELAAHADAGLMAIPSGRFFGWVMGGTLPAAMGADWMLGAWDQNAGMRYATPAVAAAEEVAGRWLVDLLGLPPESSVGFTTGGTMANFTGLAAGRDRVLSGAGWDVAQLGLSGGPRVHVLAGEQAHASLHLALRYLGLGFPTVVAADDQGRMRPDALEAALDAVPRDAPLVVCLQAGDLHSGAFDPFEPLVAATHARGGWVHVDGAFGLWAAAAPGLAHLTAGMAGADSWATDAHKTLNVPYDCGVAIVADESALTAAMSAQTTYLIKEGGIPDPYEKVPEMSRRARGVPVYAALRSLGRSGVAALVQRLHERAVAIAEGIATVPGATVLNDVVYTQVCVAFEDDERTRAVTARLIEDGQVWMSGSRWRGRDIFRVSVSNWSTDEDDVGQAVDAVRRAAGSP